MKILYINKNLNLSKPIVNQMVKMGFEVDILIESLPKALNKSAFSHKIGNVFSRLILKDKNYFIKKEKHIFEKFALKRLKNKTYDIAFFIRADMYSENLIKRVKKQTKKMINYQWDGIDIYPRILDYYKYFDRFFVFDNADMRKYKNLNLLPLTNFYYSDRRKNNIAEYDFFYIGVGLDDRIRLIKNIEEFVIANGLRIKAILTIPEFREEEITESVSFQHKGISLEENEDLATKAEVVIDFKIDYHTGASFRFFECLNREQKIITNNTEMKNYDFYHPDNIFITDFENFNGLKEFLEKPYHKIDRKIVEKYGIKNWLNYALDYGDYEAINLP